MVYSRKLGPPIVAAAVATISLTSFATIFLVKTAAPGLDLFRTLTPFVVTSAIAVTLVMSTLYGALVELVKELERREVKAQHQALHDQLTGLANRALLEDRIEQMLLRRPRTRETGALVMFDLDRFKQVNDTLGHAAGDELLRQVGERLSARLRESDTVARVGGDEFALLLAGVENSQDVLRICEELIATITAPFDLSGRETRVGVSIGAVLLGEAVDTAGLLRKADITMYRAKTAGGNRAEMFTEDMDLAVQRRDRIQTGLRRALASGEDFEVHFQPEISRDGVIVAAEALLRWHDPLLGAISPGEVIPRAEEAGLIDALGDRVFAKACEAAAALPGLTVAVNLSPSQFGKGGLAARLKGIADRAGVDPARIEIELTETLMISHEIASSEEMNELRAIGFRLALDDFGTGYSSLSYLSRFPVQKIKLDRAFIEAAHLSQNIAIIRAAVYLGHSLGLEVTAEGISTEDHERIALQAGCDTLQGYRYSRALPLHELQAIACPGRKFAIAA